MAGRYDDLAEELLVRFGAQGVLVLVIEGSKGTGMSFGQQAVEYDAALSPKLAKALPALLREVADKMEATPLPEPTVKMVVKGGKGGVN